MALFAADDLTVREGTVHLLRSTANRKRLLAALDRALTGDTAPMTMEAPREEVGLSDIEEQQDGR